MVCFPLAARVLLLVFSPRRFESGILLFLFLLPYAVILWGLLRRIPYSFPTKVGMGRHLPRKHHSGGPKHPSKGQNLPRGCQEKIVDSTALDPLLRTESEQI